MKTQYPFVSVVICTYNGASHIAQTIRALHDQTYPANAYEIVVIDDGSTDDVAAVVADAGVRVVRHEANQGLGVARNTGLRVARGEVIAYTDDDCLPEAAWLENLVAPYRDELVMATGGATFALSRMTPTERYMEASGYGNPAPYGVGGNKPVIQRFLDYMRQMVAPLHLSVRNGQALQEIYTLNASYRIQMLRGIGGFDERLRAAEDTDVSARLRAAYPDYRIVLAVGARVGHYHRSRLWPWVGQTFERSQDAFIQIRKAGRMPPLFPFPVVSVVLGSAVLVVNLMAGLAVTAVMPLALYWWWQLRLHREPWFDRIRFPYMQFLLEGAALLGYAKAFLRRSA